VVSANVGLVPDWLEEGNTGFLAEAAFPEPLDAALERAWQAQAEWPAMGLRAYERARGQVQADPAAELLQLLQAAARK
jgi:glycosyltransferase involved in cell wall biosynthesis